MIMNFTIRTALLTVILFIIINSASARIEIVDFFSDFTSSDVIIRTDKDVEHGTVLFELLYEGSVVESRKVPFKTNASTPVTKVITWQKKPLHDYYTARVSLYNGSHLFDSRSYQVSYGTAAMPDFHVVDFSPSNNGAQLLLRPFNPIAVDVRIELLDNNEIIYTETEENVYLTANKELKMDWPFLLENNREYITRAKIYTHRMYAPDLINTYIADFKATEDVEILHDDVEVDEYGASITLRGKSQVPFEGIMLITVRNRATSMTRTYRQHVEDILVSEKEDTSGVVWEDLPPGTYDVKILAVNQESIALDKYETVLRIPEEAAVEETPQVKNAKGLNGLTVFVLLILVPVIAARIKRGR